MIDEDFIKLLACPESKQSLRLGEPDLLGRLNEAIKRKALRNRANRVVETSLEAVLVREDNRWAYPVWDGIPTLLVDEAIPLDAVLSGSSDADATGR